MGEPGYASEPIAVVRPNRELRRCSRLNVWASAAAPTNTDVDYEPFEPVMRDAK